MKPMNGIMRIMLISVVLAWSAGLALIIWGPGAHRYGLTVSILGWVSILFLLLLTYSLAHDRRTQRAGWRRIVFWLIRLGLLWTCTSLWGWGIWMDLSSGVAVIGWRGSAIYASALDHYIGYYAIIMLAKCLLFLALLGQSIELAWQWPWLQQPETSTKASAADSPLQ